MTKQTKKGRIEEDLSNFKRIVSESKSVAEVSRKLGYKLSGGIHKWLKIKFMQHDIDTSHFTGQLWSKGKNRFNDSRINNQASLAETSWDEAFCYGSTFSNRQLLKRLILSGKKEYICERCGLRNYNKKAIRLQLEHKNGDSIDNREDNLEILCPNCHSQTETYSRGKRKKSKSESWWEKLSLDRQSN